MLDCFNDNYLGKCDCVFEWKRQATGGDPIHRIGSVRIMANR